MINKQLNLEIRRLFPRYAVRIAKKQFKDKEVIVIEVGTYKGEHALSILKELNVKKIYLVDAYKAYKQEDYGFESDNNNSCGKAQEELDQAKKEAKERLKDFQNTIFIEKDSAAAIKDIQEKVDFIYIDANHDYHFVLRELKNYYPLLKEGGIISGHDAHLIPVMKAVAEFAYTNNLSLSVRDSDWIILEEV